MEGWTCPRCGRLFARAGQGHDCEPGMSLDEYFATGPSHERPVFEAVLHHVETLGPVHADVVAAGIFLKNPRRFVELRPMTRWVAVSFKLPRHARHRTIVRTSIEYSPGRWWHTANVASPADLDDALLEMLTEAYLTAAGDD